MFHVKHFSEKKQENFVKNKNQNPLQEFSDTLVKWTSARPVFCFVDFVHSKKNVTSHLFILISTRRKFLQGF